ncbi:hypothetical protein BDV11DRAFT_181464 [Aspergillus similis]
MSCLLHYSIQGLALGGNLASIPGVPFLVMRVLYLMGSSEGNKDVLINDIYRSVYFLES